MQHAISLDTLDDYMYYRLGCVYERTHEYSKAVDNYILAIKKEEKFNNYWRYRLAYSLYKSGDFQKSTEAFKRVQEGSEYFQTYSLEDETLYEKSTLITLSKSDIKRKTQELEDRLSRDSTDAKLFYKLALLYEIDGNYEEAQKNYILALQREDSFKAYWYYRLGFVQSMQAKYEEACESFLQQRVLQEVHGVVETPYHKNFALRKIINYTEYYEHYELDESMILYESYHGASISCNPFAIFKTLLNDSRFSKFKHIWVIKDESKIPNEFKTNRNIIFIKRESDSYMRYLAKAKYLINNVTFSDYFIRKESQVYLNTWHGTPIKFLGKDIKDGFMAHKNVTRNFLQASHLIEPNEFTTDILIKRYAIEGIVNATIKHTGYPRQDLMLNYSDAEKKRLKKRLNIKEGSKVVLYAPTWRGLHSGAVFNTSKLVDDIQKIKSVSGSSFLFRGHHMVEDLLVDVRIKDSIVPSDIDTNSLLSIVDILITDYSSIAFDFMALQRPIIYYAYDIDEYKKERGLYFPLEDISDDICFSSQELKLLIEKNIVSDTLSKKQINAQKKFCSYDDSKATQRVVDLLFFNEQKSVEKPAKKSLLFYGGPFIANGVTSSFINLLNQIDSSKYIVSVVVEPHLMSNFKERMEQVSRVNPEINLIARVGRVLMTLEEKWNVDKFNLHRELPHEKMQELHTKAFKREFRRIFGDAKFDYIINFEGYNVFWQAILGAKQNEEQHNTSYLHSNMYGEWKLRFPYLEKNFRLYRNYDHLVSVSEQTKMLNMDSLSELFDIDKEKFIYCDNVQNPEDLLKKAQKELDNVKYEPIFKDTKVFINIARLSPEKDQEKLIRAFEHVVQKHPQARLVNLGSGPLEHTLKLLIKELKLEEKVYLLGQRFNPYPYLKKSDCFILSSNHEGQPMTLFEAMILKKPVIATNIVGNRSVLEGRGGLLVDNSKEGLESGMLDFLEGRYIEERVFDYKEYNTMALNMFYEKVCR